MTYDREKKIWAIQFKSLIKKNEKIKDSLVATLCNAFFNILLLYGSILDIAS